MKDFHDHRFHSIQTLRGLAALMVVCEHIRFLACGAFGVDIFFCISGFMIMYTTHHSTKGFFRKRLVRIVPFYYVITLGVYVMLVLFPSMFEQTHASLSLLIKSLLFIPFDIGNGVIQPIVRIGWTVNCEMFFYLLFWLSLRISHKYRGFICLGLLLCCTGLGALLSGGNTWIGDSLMAVDIQAGGSFIGKDTTISSLLALFFLYGNPVMLEFGLGILSYYVARALYEHTKNTGTLCNKSIGIPALGLSLLLFAGLILSTGHVNILGYRRLLYWGIPAMLIFLGFLLAGYSLKMPHFSVRLGDISFSLYLIHYYPIMFLDRKVFDFSTLTFASAIGAAAGIAAVIILAYAAWYVIENKLTVTLRRKLFPVK
ncbi:MAG: acyltransferase [Lachnospiraceae bacterium]|nr:acyltransferase [Lachnospiraceae bacterium]